MKTKICRCRYSNWITTEITKAKMSLIHDTWLNPFLSTNDQEKGSDELLNGLMNSELRSIVEWMNEVESSWILNSNLFSRWFLQVSMIESGQKLVLWPLLFDWHFLYFKACFWVRKLGKNGKSWLLGLCDFISVVEKHQHITNTV